MAKYDVTHSCGHAETIQLVGRTEDRQRRIDWLEALGLCSTCFAERRRQQREKANGEAEKWAADVGLPALQGSEKQCAWAETIRREKLAELRVVERAQRGMASRLDEKGQEILTALVESSFDANLHEIFAYWLDEHGHAEGAAAHHACAWLIRQGEAKWWIDHRYQGALELVMAKVQEPARLAQAEAERQQQREAAQAKRREEEERQRKLWEAKDAIIRRLQELTGFPTSCKVWMDHTDTEKRVYITIWNGGRSGVEGCYYHTGNRRNRPGTLALRLKAEDLPGGREALASYLGDVAKAWNRLTVEPKEGD